MGPSEETILQDLYNQVADLTEKLSQFNGDHHDRTTQEGRRIAIAVTHMETAELFLEKAIKGLSGTQLPIAKAVTQVSADALNRPDGVTVVTTRY